MYRSLVYALAYKIVPHDMIVDWFTIPNPLLDKKSPIEYIKDGGAEKLYHMMKEEIKRSENVINTTTKRSTKSKG